MSGLLGQLNIQLSVLILGELTLAILLGLIFTVTISMVIISLVVQLQVQPLTVIISLAVQSAVQP